MSGSSCARLRSSTGVRSAPPPNHQFVVTMKRVFMCTAGTCGLRGWMISEMPLAQKRGSSAAPGICRGEFRRESAMDGRAVNAGLLEEPAMQHRHHATAAVCLFALPGLAREASVPGRLSLKLAFKRFEAGADFIAQGLEPGSCAVFLRGEGIGRGIHGGITCRKSPVTAQIKEPAAGESGRRSGLVENVRPRSRSRRRCRGGRDRP